MFIRQIITLVDNCIGYAFDEVLILAPRMKQPRVNEHSGPRFTAHSFYLNQDNKHQ